MITKRQLQIANQRSLKYPLDIAEKDYCLAEAVKLISESPLGEKIVFKGGTAIHHCYLPQHRFSEDLDFTSLDKNLRMDEVVETLEATGDFVVKKKFESPATLKIERLVYSGILDQPGAIKVEIDRKQNVALPAVERKYENVWGVEATIKTMAVDEIVAEKVRTTANRVRYRDFYDLYLLLEEPETNLEDALELLQEKEIRAVVSPAAIVANWQAAKADAANEKRKIHFTRAVADEAIGEMIQRFTFAPILPPTKE
jgi:predicted nucleotidyltransferase component of viral defense system